MGLGVRMLFGACKCKNVGVGCLGRQGHGCVLGCGFIFVGLCECIVAGGVAKTAKRQSRLNK